MRIKLIEKLKSAKSLSLHSTSNLEAECISKSKRAHALYRQTAETHSLYQRSNSISGQKKESAKEWRLAMTIAKVLANGMPDKLEWLKNQTDAMTECGDTPGALQLFKDASERFGEDGKYLLAVGPQYALLCDIEEAKKYVKRAFKADSSLKAEFLDDPAFDPVWESF